MRDSSRSGGKKTAGFDYFQLVDGEDVLLAATRSMVPTGHDRSQRPFQLTSKFHGRLFVMPSSSTQSVNK